MNNTLGETIKKLRYENNMTQITLSKIINVSKSTISGWETGSRKPSNEDLIALADLFSVTTDYLLNRNVINDIQKNTIGSYQTIKYRPIILEKKFLSRIILFIAILFSILIIFYDQEFFIIVFVFAWFIVSIINIVSLFAKRRKILVINIPTNENLIYQFTKNPKEIKKFHFENIFHLVLNFLFAFFGYILAISYLEDVNMFNDGIYGMLSFFILLLFVYYLYIIFYECTKAQKKVEVDFYDVNGTFYLGRFKILPIINGICLVFTNLAFYANRHELLDIDIITMILLVINFLLSYLLVILNTLFYSRYDLFTFNPANKQRSKL